MVQNKSVEQLDNSAVKLTVTVGKEDVQSQYDELVAKYAKTAQIKGFRKGKVPRTILERKFGDAFRYETLEKILDESLKEALEEIEEQPLPYSQPELQDQEDVDLELGKDFTYSVKYDVYPSIEIGDYRGLTITEPQVKISKEDEDQELESLRQQNALLMERDSEPVAEQDSVTLDIRPLNESGEVMQEAEMLDANLTVGEKQNYYEIDDDIVGMTVGETKEIAREYPEDFHVSDLAGTTQRLQVTVKSAKYRDVPELDDEFAQDVNEDFETLDDLRKDVRSRLQEDADRRVRQEKVDQLLDQIVDASTIPLPESMVYAELRSAWRNFAQQYGLQEDQLEQLLAAQGKERDELLEEWRPDAEKRLKRNLVTHKMVELEEISVTPEEAEEHLRKQAENRPGSPDQVVEYYRNNGMLPYVQQELAEDRLFDVVLEATTVKKGKKTTYLDLVKQNR